MSDAMQRGLVILSNRIQGRDAIGRSAIQRLQRMDGISANVNELVVMPIVSLRLTVGSLGERDGANWWRSGCADFSLLGAMKGGARSISTYRISPNVASILAPRSAFPWTGR
jgi:hypothetical protein